MYYVYCDGAIEPKNPGGHGVGGFVVKNADHTVLIKGAYDFGQYPELTNNAVEYGAIAAAFQHLAKAGMTEKEVCVRTDSQLVVRQLNGDYGCSPKMAKLRDIVTRLSTLFPKVTYEWVPREQNKEADAMSRSLYTE